MSIGGANALAPNCFFSVFLDFCSCKCMVQWCKRTMVLMYNLFLINAMKRSMKMECESFHLVPHFSPHGHSKSILLRVERQWVVRRWSTEIDRDQLKLLKRMWREKYVWSWVCCFYHIAFRLFRDLDSCLLESCKLPSCLARKRCFAVPCVSNHVPTVWLFTESC